MRYVIICYNLTIMRGGEGMQARAGKGRIYDMYDIGQHRHIGAYMIWKRIDGAERDTYRSTR